MRNKLPCDRIEMSSSVYTMCKIYCLLYTTHAQATLWCALGCVLRKLNSGLAFKLSSVIIMLGWLAWNVHLHISTYLETMFIESRVNVIHKGRGQKKTVKKRSGWPLWGGGHPPPAWPKLFVRILGLFFHWIWFLDTQNRFYFIVKRLKNASSFFFWPLPLVQYWVGIQYKGNCVQWKLAHAALQSNVTSADGGV